MLPIVEAVAGVGDLALVIDVMSSHGKIGAPIRGFHPRKAVRWAMYIAVSVIVLLGVGAYFAVAHWPFRYKNVKPLLQGVFSSNVEIDHFSRIYFPHPGFIAKGIRLRRDSAPGLPPVGSAKELLIESNWMDMVLLRKEIRLVRVVGLHVVVPPVGSDANRKDFPPGSSGDFRGPTTTVDELQMSNSLLDIMRTNGKRYSFPIREIVVRHVQRDHDASYIVDMQNAKPNGRIQAKGSFGPLMPKNLGETPVSGSFTFTDANLSDVGKLHGTLSASGHFSGSLDAIAAKANGRVTDFAVGHGHPIAITGTGQATVNGLNGDVVFNAIDARSGNTVLHAQGNMAGSPAVTELDLLVRQGRAEDLLRPFLHGEVPIVGEAWMKAHAHVDPAENGRKFLQRLKMDGTLGVPAGLLTSASTEKNLTAFSDRVQKPSPLKKDAGDTSSSAAADVLSSLKANAAIHNGVLYSQQVMFDIPGAAANLKGTFDLQSGKVDLLGNIRMQHNISHAVTGFKSILLKPLIPFFRHRTAGAVVPIAVTGTPGKYHVSENIFHQKG